MTAMRRARRQMHAQQTNDATERNTAPRRDATLYPYRGGIPCHITMVAPLALQAPLGWIRRRPMRFLCFN